MIETAMSDPLDDVGPLCRDLSDLCRRNRIGYSEGGIPARVGRFGFGRTRAATVTHSNGTVMLRAGSQRLTVNLGDLLDIVAMAAPQWGDDDA